jgi:HAE1 family hydrophobic/amphiphilic exporter-1
MLFLAVVVIGFISVKRLAVDLMPEVDAPRISISTQYEGVAPQEIETLITRPIEQAVSTIQGVEKIEATSSEGSSRVQLQFLWGTDLDEAVNEVRTYLDRIRNRLPEEADAPTVWKFNLSDFPVAYLGLSGGGDVRRIRYLAEELLSRRLERVQGVASVEVRGGRVREIQVRLDADQLSSLGISAQQVSRALARENQDISAGDMLDDQREVVIRTAGEFRALEDISSTVVTYREGRPVYVRDLGEVADSFQDVKSELWIDEKPGIRLRIAKQSGANTVEVVNSLREEVDRINEEYEGRLRLTVLMDSSEFIKQAVTNVQSAAFYGALLALVVLMVFLRDWRATLVISTSIPISVLATFALMYFYGFTLNVISFGGLALGIGMLVDSAIVVLENIYRKRELKMGHSQAAVEGSREVAAAVVAGTLTTVTVFFPVVFMPGFAGIFFKEMAVVVCFALVCSLTVALMLIPMLSAKVLRGQPGQNSARLSGKLYSAGESLLAGLERVYGALVRTALRSPFVTVLLALILLLSSSALVPVIGYELMPEADEGRLNISVKLPIGTPLERTIQVMQDMEQRVMDLLEEGELDHIMTVAGPARSWRPGTANQGSLELALVPVSQRQRSVEQIGGVIRPELAHLPGVEFQVRPGSSNILMWIMRGGGDRLSVDIRGHDLDMSARLADQVAEVMKTIPGVADVDIAREPGKMERIVHADRERLAELGLGGSDMAEAVEHYVLGKVSTRYREEGYEYDIRVQLHPRDREHIQQLPHLPIISTEGRLLPLASVAEIASAESPTSITREDQERILKVNAGIADRSLGDIVEDLQRALRRIAVPEGFSVSVGGEYLEQQRMFGDLLVGLLIAVFLVYAVMVVQFESLLHPLVIMTAVPFGFVGVVLSLYLTSTTFNINSFLGSIVLVGIMVNNSIVLVDYVNLLRREHGIDLYEALVEGARRRLRPVLMTTTTTVLAMLPLAMGLGEGSELQAPLARVIVGGLITSTLITLVFVPSLYFLIERRRAFAPAAEEVAMPASVRLAD